MILVNAYKLRDEIKKSDGYADSEYGKGICAGISRALQKINEAEIFDINKHDEAVQTVERREFVEFLKNRHRYLGLISTDELESDLVEYEKRKQK